MMPSEEDEVCVSEGRGKRRGSNHVIKAKTRWHSVGEFEG